MRGITIESTTLGDVAVAHLSGDIDLANHAEVREELLRLGLAGGPIFVVDFSGVGYVDSNGVRALFTLAREFAQSRINWVVALAPEAKLHRMFKVTAFDEVARFADSVEAAAELLRTER